MINDRAAVSVEDRPEFAIAFAFAWPSACGWGTSLEVALQRLASDIAFTADWLNERGHDVPPVPTMSDFVIAERLPATGNPDQCDTEGFYACDARPYSDDDLVRTALLLDLSRADLLTTVAGLSDVALDRRLAEETRTVREIIDHVAIAEWWYTTRIVPEEAIGKGWRDYGDDAFTRLVAIRRMFLREHLGRLAELPAGERTTQYQRGRELWSARKTLRRAFWHEMFHYKQLLRLVPEVRWEQTP